MREDHPSAAEAQKEPGFKDARRKLVDDRDASVLENASLSNPVNLLAEPERPDRGCVGTEPRASASEPHTGGMRPPWFEIGTDAGRRGFAP
ncbi:MAG: hypothetical protein EDS66_08930 [Planctomycetota bacterium]|nr:MAG: hypothetical protein EDS66_08930 [Planctomycetota bacterium]MCQ3921455.1 hypothetical protein [Planctomycetota bacterium]